MKRRIAVFAIVWAYAACWLWLPFAGFTSVTALHFFPPGYFFVLGALFGIVHELLASRLKRPLATIAVLPLALELGHWLYNGNAIGFLLGGILAVAVLPASFIAHRLQINRTLAIYLAAFSGIGAMLWPIVAGSDSIYAGKTRISPNGIFTARSTNDFETLTKIASVRVDLKNAPMGAFGRIVELNSDTDPDELTEGEVTEFQWQGPLTLQLDMKHSRKAPPPSPLLPIEVVLRNQQWEGRTQAIGHGWKR